MEMKDKGQPFTQQSRCVLATEPRLLRCMRVLEKCRIVNPDMRLLGEFPEPKRSIQVQLPSLLLSTPPKIFLLQVKTNIFYVITIEKALVYSVHCAHFISSQMF